MSLRTAKDASAEAIQNLAMTNLDQRARIQELENLLLDFKKRILEVWGNLEAGSKDSESLFRIMDDIDRNFENT